MSNRREFLKNASLLTMGGLFAGKTVYTNAANKTLPTVSDTNASKTIGLQIYSLFKELYDDVPRGLKRLKQMGYTNLELAGYRDRKINNIEMDDFKKMADDAGLTIISTHVNPPVREYTPSNQQEIMDFWKIAADDHAKIGVKYLIQPGQPFTRSIEEVSYVSEIFNEAGKIAKAAGLSFGYHNHEMEFARVIPGGKEFVFGRRGLGREEPEGIEVIYDGFLKRTNPSLVFFEMDVYWTVMGQNDPVQYLKKYPDRIKVLHIKDRSVLGESGMMNFEKIFQQANINGIKDYFVELERMPEGTGTQFDGVKGCVDFLLNASFVK